MNDHVELKKMLSAFAAGDLTEQECRRMELHLAECADCRAELANLRAVIRLLRTIPEVEPPVWMASRIMASLKEKQTCRRGWLHRFFFPLHIKLPIEALALLVICVSGYYLSRNVDSELHQAAVSQQSDIPLSRSMPVQEQYGSGRRSPAVLPEVRQPSAATPPKAYEAPDLQTQPAVPPSFEPAPPAITRESAAPAFVDGKGAAVTSETSGRMAESRHEMKKAAKGGGRDEVISFAPSPAKLAAESSSGKSVAVMILRLDVHGRPDAERLIRSAAFGSGARIIEEVDPHFGQIRVRIPFNRIAELKERLTEVGKVVEMPKIPEYSQELELTVKW